VVELLERRCKQCENKKQLLLKSKLYIEDALHVNN